MPETITFQHIVHYSMQTSGIFLPVLLEFAGKNAKLKAKVDTGASYCIFWRGYGEDLGLNIEQGIQEEISTVMGNFLAYGHPLTLTVPGVSLETTVYFAAHPQFNRNVLGMQGWIDRLKLGLIDYEGKLLMNRYDE